MNTVQHLPDGRYDVQDETGKSVLDQLGGPFHTKGAAEACARMLNGFERVESRIDQINSGLRSAQFNRETQDFVKRASR